MIKRFFEELSIVSLDQERMEIHLKELFAILSKKTSDIIYITVRNRLYGVVSVGDIKRSRGEEVKINRQCTCLVNWDYMQAKKIFQENGKINKLPVIDEMGHLMGDYSRWDDKRWYSRRKGVSIKGIFDRLRNEEIILVDSGEAKQWMLEYEKLFLDRENIKYTISCMKDITLVINPGNTLVFIDEEDLYCFNSICKELVKNNIKLYTFRMIVEDECVWYEEKSILYQLKERGVQCLTLSYKSRDSVWYHMYRDTLKKRFVDVDEDVFFPKKFAKEFFEELYSEEYYEFIVNVPLEMYCVNGVNKIKDVESKFFNVSNGQRVTVGQPKKSKNTIYFFGPCIMIGRYVEDRYTIESLLQKSLNRVGLQYKVVNCGAYNNKKIDINRILETNFSSGDIVIVWAYDRSYPEVPNINLSELAERYHIPIQWTLNTLPHCNHKVNKILADEILSKIQSELGKKNVLGMSDLDELRREYIRHNYIKRYFIDFDYTKYDKIGSIVMNCNPFTNGHRYLIETACQVVDFLIIFVVEEDRSFFSFEERFEMVKEGVNDFNQVMVVPSGQFILSETTFPEYFLKIQDEDIYRNVDYDIMLFADYIASELHITYRFVGEEPSDNVTNEYNNAMKRILPGKGITLMEIPRKKDGGMHISASEVRKNMEKNKSEKAYRLVPDTTRKVLGWA